MDINVFRGISTLMALATFVGIWVWAWSSNRNTAFSEASNQLFDEKEEADHQRSLQEMNAESEENAK